MRVHDLMTAPAHTCHAHDSLETAATLLAQHDCGLLPVVDGDGRVGAVITDRDICMAAARLGRPLADLRVVDSMSHDLVTCRPVDDVDEVAQRMAERRLRRIPVVDEEHRVCGVLSLRDLAAAAERDPVLAVEALKVLVALSRRTERRAAAVRASAPAPRRMLRKL